MNTLLNSKERDNTWLQLPVCPVVFRAVCQHAEGSECSCKDPPDLCLADSKCRSNYAHPAKHVLQHALSSGYVVCCQAFVFSTYGSNPGKMCSRGEANCKYYHPPEHLALLVINAGRNNKRLRGEVAARIKVAAASSLLPGTLAASCIQTVAPHFQHSFIPAYHGLQTIAEPLPPGVGQEVPVCNKRKLSSVDLPSTDPEQLAKRSRGLLPPTVPQQVLPGSWPQWPHWPQHHLQINSTPLVLIQPTTSLPSTSGATYIWPYQLDAASFLLQPQ